MNYNRPGLFNLHTIGATTQKRLRITDPSFQCGKSILLYALSLRQGEVHYIVVVSAVPSKQLQLN